VTIGAAGASREADRKGGDNITNIVIKSGGNARNSNQHEENHEMTEHQIVDSSFTAIINAPIEKVDIPT